MTERTRFQESRTAQQVADALRTAYVARQAEGDSAEVTAITANLLLLGNVEEIPAVAKPGLASGVIKIVRGVLRVFLKPWLNVQTMFNHDIAQRFQVVASGVTDLQRRTPQLEESLHHLERRLQALERVPEHAVRSGAGPAPSTLASLERMFVHVHLPRPPARVLVVGTEPALVAELTAFGFVACAIDETPGPSRDGRSCRSALAAWPFPAAVFDVVIRLCADEGAQGDGDADVMAEAARVLKPGAALVMTLPSHRAPVALLAASDESSTLRIARVMVAERTGDGWRVKARSAAATLQASGVTHGQAVLIHAQRIDVSDR